MKRLPRRLRHGEEATLVEHLGELRTRIGIALGAILIGAVVAFVFRHTVIEWLNRPLPEGIGDPITLSPGEPFLTSLKLSIYAGFLMALPIVLWQVWSFMAPALEEGTQRIAAVFAVISALLLIGGLVFGYYIALPKAISFLTNFDSELYDTELRARDYYGFATVVMFAMGMVFQLPIFILALVKLGVLSTEKLRRNRRIGYVAVAALAVALPGVDPVTMLFELIPLLILFEASIWASALLDRRRPSDS